MGWVQIGEVGTYSGALKRMRRQGKGMLVRELPRKRKESCMVPPSPRLLVSL